MDKLEWALKGGKVLKGSQG